MAGIGIVFQLAPDGGLFLPDEIKKFSEIELIELSKLNYIDLGVEIISKFCVPVLKKDKIKSLLHKAYSNFSLENVVEMKKIDNIINLNVIGYCQF